VGGKAANMGELAKVKIKRSQRLPIPEILFAIPFYFYNQHITEHHIDTLINALLLDKNSAGDKKLLSAKLEQIRDSIESAPLSEALIKMVTDRIGDARDINFRFRSSTNAEDVPGFNGAGLYDSKTGNVSNLKRPIERAIREVWASLWKQRAFEERMFFNIDQTNLAMGILVNKAFGTEEANGVAVTKNLYRDDYPAFTVNIQKGEESIVQPDDSIRAEQFLVNLSEVVTGSNDIAVDYICHSSLQPGSPLLTKAEIKVLTEYLLAIKKHFWKVYPKKGGTTFNNFGMDVEFKLDAGTRKIFVKQARVY
jgi:pyruvate,water dikinase